MYHSSVYLSTTMKVYFACSIRGGRDNAKTYKHFADYISERATLLTEIFADEQLTSEGSKGKSADIHKKDLGWVKDADVMIAEVSTPSLGVGYEISKAEELNKPILALYDTRSEHKLSAMIDGSENVIVCRYSNLGLALANIDAFIAKYS